MKALNTSTRGMSVQDVSHNRRIASLGKLTQELAQSATPMQTIQALQRGFAEAHGFLAWVLLSTRGLPEGQYRVIATQLHGGPLNELPDQAPPEPLPVHTGGVVAALIAHAEPHLTQEVDWAADPHFHAVLKGYSSVMALPIAGAHLPMTWVLLLKPPPQRFTALDLEEGMERIALSSSLLETRVLAEQLASANEHIDREARQVGELQRALLPATLPRIAGLDISVSYEPSSRASGDLYDFFPLDDRRTGHSTHHDPSTPWCVFVGDAAGHGLAAAVVMAILQSVLHSNPIDTPGPATLLAHANRELCRKNLGGFVTAFLGVYEPASRRLTYVNAGHPPVLVKRSSDGAVRMLDSVLSYPLGIDDSETFSEATLNLEPGDIMLLYTDGITEASDTHRHLFDQERLTQVLRHGGDEPAKLIERLREAVQAHQQNQPATDDQTLVAARVL